MGLVMDLVVGPRARRQFARTASGLMVSSAQLGCAGESGAALEKQRLPQPEDPQFASTCQVIVPDFAEINRELMTHFAMHPADLQHLDWRKFEELLDAVFRNQGYITELGPGRADGGVDLRLIQKDGVGEILTLVQARKWDPRRPIELAAVQALAAVVDDEKANRGLFVTTSRYLPSAAKFAERQKRRITLATSKEVAMWCHAAAATWH